MPTIDPEIVEEKLNACLPHLVSACENWAAAGLEDGPIIMAVATPRSAQVLRAGGWPEYEIGCARDDAAKAVIAAVESPISDAGCNVIAAGISVLLGAEGRQVHLQDVTAIRQRGEIPVLVFMLADADTMTFTTTGVARPTLH
ncbi:hypothetical protein ACT4MK_18200 [Bradyrhizobium barranii]|uniref:hypothetical protein n=1 Tax=Bradyrhizobium barranii TaxID=2992140 RepID=UPI0040338472